MKTIVIYHSADFDGIFCREIARKFLPDAELIGWDYGQPVPPMPVDAAGTQLYMLDISIEPLMSYPGLIWIDHHKSAIEKWGYAPPILPDVDPGRPGINGYQIDGVAACRLAWQWFTHEYASHVPGNQIGYPLPSKKEFVERTVSEPLSIRLAGEYDIWDKRDPDAELFQHGLRSRDLTNDWPLLLSLDSKATIEEIERLISVGHRNILRPDGTNPNPIVLGLLENGRALQYAQTQQNESIIKAMGFTIQFEGLTFLACNHARYNSHLFTAGIKPEHDALFGFKWDGQQWSVSLYHAPGKEHHDLSLIAVRHGGGGHKGACGFRTKSLPFLT